MKKNFKPNKGLSVALCCKVLSDLKRTDVSEEKKVMFCLNVAMLNFKPINLN